jgi:phospholipid N-methyltransferase
MSDDVNFPDKWEANYAGGTDGWDLGGPTPTFRRLAANGQIKSGRMIVLGAGRGYDAREFARHGFQVTAVDFAPYAVREMHRLYDPAAPINAMHHDLFRLPRELDRQFDYVLEYTCFCAIDPKRRAEYADVVARLLKPQGIYIDLAFPLDRHDGGPPFTVAIDEVLGLFTVRGFELIRRETPIDSVESRRGREELLILRHNSINPNSS